MALKSGSCVLFVLMFVNIEEWEFCSFLHCTVTFGLKDIDNTRYEFWINKSIWLKNLGPLESITPERSCYLFPIHHSIDAHGRLIPFFKNFSHPLQGGIQISSNLMGRIAIAKTRETGSKIMKRGIEKMKPKRRWQKPIACWLIDWLIDRRDESRCWCCCHFVSGSFCFLFFVWELLKLTKISLSNIRFILFLHNKILMSSK